MTLLEVVLIAIALAMDCFAVAIASSIAYGHYNWLKMARMAFFFGLFQGIMPLLGWLAGVSFSTQIAAVDHWLALLILGYLGIKMVVNGCCTCNKKASEELKSPFGSWRMLLVLSVATSIDALATGFIFVPMGHLIFTASCIIFTVSFVFTLLGVIIGVTFGKRFKLNVEIIGGIILIIIGLKIFIEHVFTNC